MQVIKYVMRVLVTACMISEFPYCLTPEFVSLKYSIISVIQRVFKATNSRPNVRTILAALSLVSDLCPDNSGLVLCSALIETIEHTSTNITMQLTFVKEAIIDTEISLFFSVLMLSKLG